MLRKIGIALTVFLVTGLVACHGEDTDKTPSSKLVKAVVVGHYQATTTRTFPGVVSADKQVNLAFEVPGRIERFPIKEGSQLKKGALIAAIDPESYRTLYDRNKARFELADAQLKRAKDLVKKGYLSQSDYDQRVSDYDVGKADFEHAAIDLKNTELTAPFDGIVTKKVADQHEYVQAKQRIVVYKAVDEINIEANIPERVIAHVKGPHDTTVKVIFEVEPDHYFLAKLKEFSADADPQTKTYKVTVTLPRPKHPIILPGMTARIEVPLVGDRKPYLLLPVSAVFEREAKSMIWVVKPDDHTVVERTVTVGQMQGNQIEIISGVHPGETVVVAGVNFLQSGNKVTIMSPDEQSVSEQRNG